jgi:hypothetical protein
LEEIKKKKKKREKKERKKGKGREGVIKQRIHFFSPHVFLQLGLVPRIKSLLRRLSHKRDHIIKLSFVIMD